LANPVQLNFGGREVTIKLACYGPPLSGKTTNLRALHERIAPGRARLMTLETEGDRMLCFDMLPFVGPRDRDSVPGGSPMTLRLKIFALPGQVLHMATRRLLLHGADGVAFIADSQRNEAEANAAALVDLRDNLRHLGLSIKEMPLVTQYNKRDAPDVCDDAEIEARAKKGKEPVFMATARARIGVLESFVGLLHLTWTRLEHEHQLSRTVGVAYDEFLTLAARDLGYSGDVAQALAACIGGTLPPLHTKGAV
jgi:hypothetical protein